MRSAVIGLAVMVACPFSVATDFGAAAQAAARHAQQQQSALSSLPAQSFWGAVRDGDLALARQHLEQGFPVDSPSPTPEKVAALEIALKGHALPMVHWLLERGAQPDSPRVRDLAYHAGQQEEARTGTFDTRYLAALQEKGVNWNQPGTTWYQRPIIFQATTQALSPSAQALQWLLSQGANPNTFVDGSHNERCITPMDEASAPILAILMAHGADAWNHQIHKQYGDDHRHVLTSQLHRWISGIDPIYHPYKEYRGDRTQILPGRVQEARKELQQSEQVIRVLLDAGLSPRHSRIELDLPEPIDHLACPEINHSVRGYVQGRHAVKKSTFNALAHALTSARDHATVFPWLLNRALPLSADDSLFDVFSKMAYDLAKARETMVTIRLALAQGKTQPVDCEPDMLSVVYRSVCKPNEDAMGYAQALAFWQEEENKLWQNFMLLRQAGSSLNPPAEFEGQPFETFWRVNDTRGLLQIAASHRDPDLYARFTDLGASPFVTAGGRLDKLLLDDPALLARLHDHLVLPLKIAPWCQALSAQLDEASRAAVPRSADWRSVVQTLQTRLHEAPACRATTKP